MWLVKFSTVFPRKSISSGADRKHAMSCCATLGSVMILWGTAGPAPALPAAGPPPQVIELWLDDALFRGDDPSEGPASLLLLLRHRGDQWERAWGVARDLNVRVHSGRVRRANFTDRRLAVDLAMCIAGGRPRGVRGRA